MVYDGWEWFVVTLGGVAVEGRTIHEQHMSVLKGVSPSEEEEERSYKERGMNKEHKRRVRREGKRPGLLKK
jgi:hypothetical protein